MITTIQGHEALWTPTKLGSIALPHRLAMAPMTRSRATADGHVTGLTAEYYAQRATMSMLVTEGTQPSADGQGYLATPGIHTPEQADAWRRVADVVHDAGSALVVQLMHVGRVAHPSNTPHGRRPLAPSEVAADAQMFTSSGPQPMAVPRAMTEDDLARTVADFREAARLAVQAGADGVELHGANGYLLHQFLSSNANRRTDSYGGSVDNRIRFAVEVAAAVADEIGADRVGFRISPGNPLNDIVEDDVAEVYRALVGALAPLGLAYLHVVHAGDEPLLRMLRDVWPGGLVVNRAGADLARRVQDVDDGLADVITVGSPALANPDLVARLRAGAPLNAPDPATFYGGGERGYTDYPLFAALPQPSRSESTMRAIRFSSYGDPSVLEPADVPVPEAGSGEALVRVAATTFNQVDATIRAGFLQQVFPLQLPHVPGIDVSGTVAAVGPDVPGDLVGTDVVAFLPMDAPGAAAEYVVVPAALLTAAPATVPLADAAALPSAGLTAWQALVEHAAVQPGQRVLVNGAGGGVGGFAVQLAASLGATVVATAGPRSAAAVRAAGADEVVDYTRTPVTDAVREPVDVVLNLVRTSPVETAALVRLVRPGGVLVSTTTPGEADTERGVRTSSVFVRSDAEQLAHLVSLVDAGTLRLDIGARYPLDELAQVHARAESGQLRGRTLVVVAG